MTIQWIAELPDGAGSGSHTRMVVDGAGNVHLLYVDDVTDSLMHAVGTPKFLPQVVSPLGSTGVGVIVGHQWTLENLENASYSDPTYHYSDSDLNDLALDSQGRLHLCLCTMDQLSHAVRDPGGQFVLTAVEKKLGSLADLRMTIGKDDAVHIAYALPDDSHGNATLKHASRASGSATFLVETVDHRRGWFSNVSIATSGAKTGISYINGVWGTSGGNDTFALMYAEKTTGAWTAEVANPGPRASGFPPNVPGAVFADRGANSLILDNNTAPFIAFFSDGVGLRIGSRAPAAGSAWSAGVPVDAAGQASPATLLVEPNGTLHLVYQAQGAAGTELRLATKAGFGPWTTGTIDAGLDSGFAISAAMTANGQTHIAYGFVPVVNGLVKLKYTFSTNVMLPIPIKKPKRPIIIPLPRAGT